ncbi:MAG: glutaredoxin 3 [Legionellales bacterium]|nr:glutaredoxin 3 [Legionellales bacterium]|tara:strand:- start:340 stop:618 length:279 start_codon:yes stop_codon:yes gene_type:complete
MSSRSQPNFIIYSKEYCPYCDRAKALITQQGWSYSEKRIDLDPALYQEFQHKTNQARTVPQIFYNEQLIGGFDQLYQLHTSGELARLINTED